MHIPIECGTITNSTSYVYFFSVSFVCVIFYIKFAFTHTDRTYRHKGNFLLYFYKNCVFIALINN